VSTPPTNQRILVPPSRFGIALLLSLAASLLVTPAARADIPLSDPARSSGWEVTTSGRVDSYGSWLGGETVNRNGMGSAISGGAGFYTLVGPQIAIIGNPTPAGAVGDPVKDMNVNSTRVRGGFASTVLNFNISKQISPTVKLSFRLGLWAGIQNSVVGSVRAQNDVAGVDWREQFLKLDTPYGTLVAGRALGLFNRGGMRVNWWLMHRYGVGHPCTVDSGGTASCGHTGVGSLHPGRNAQVSYATPELAGLQLTVAALDPSMIPASAGAPLQWVRTIYPRAEFELTFHRGAAGGASGGNELNLFVNGLWQLIGMSTEIAPDANNDLPGVPADATRTVWGVGGGGWGRIGVLGLGGTYWAGRGLGTGFSFSTTAVDPRGTMRLHFGYLGIANLKFDNGLEIATSYGSSNVKETDFDHSPPPALDLFSVVKEVRGIGGLIAYHYGPVTFSIDGMNIRTTWHKGEVLAANVISGGVLGEW